MIRPERRSFNCPVAIREWQITSDAHNAVGFGEPSQRAARKGRGRSDYFRVVVASFFG